jgi:hypothetical protein
VIFDKIPFEKGPIIDYRPLFNDHGLVDLSNIFGD